MKFSDLMNGLVFGMLQDHMAEQTGDSINGKHFLRNYLFQ